MRLRNVKGSREAISLSGYVIKDAASMKGSWYDFFGNKAPIYLEIGMGKGRFLMDMARLHPNIHFIGIEMFSSVLVRALEKMEEDPLPNVHFLRMDAQYITDVFSPGEVSRIYLNFSDPWPKEKHAKRRLTSRRFLERYDRILEKNAPVIFKTDNRDLFDFSLEEAREAGWTGDMVTYDLHHSEYLDGNIMTEYEERFVKKGIPICKMIIHHEI